MLSRARAVFTTIRDSIWTRRLALAFLVCFVVYSTFVDTRKEATDDCQDRAYLSLIASLNEERGLAGEVSDALGEALSSQSMANAELSDTFDVVLDPAVTEADAVKAIRESSVASREAARAADAYNNLRVRLLEQRREVPIPTVQEVRSCR
jgi:hypothetical protein